MGREPNPTRAVKVTPRIPAQAHRRLEMLAKMGLFGSTASEVAKYLIVEGIKGMITAGIQPAELPPE